MITGDWLMFRAVTCGLTPWGSPTPARLLSIAARVSFTFVPNENWATTTAIELADVDCTLSRRATFEIARSIGFVTWSVTSAAPAPG